jgi:hypothetical protein
LTQWLTSCVIDGLMDAIPHPVATMLYSQLLPQQVLQDLQPAQPWFGLGLFVRKGLVHV